MEVILKKAQTLREIYNTFKPEEYLTPEKKDFYVNIFEDDLKTISDMLEWSENSQETIFVAGQPGNGKSTALHLLPQTHPVINELYEVLYLNGRDKFDPAVATDAVDVMLMVGFLFAKQDKTLRDKYIKSLEKLQDEKLGELEKVASHTATELNQEITGIDSGFKIDLKILKIGADFEDNFRFDEETKITTRKLLKSKKKDFIDATNKIISEYSAKLNGKKVLLVIDDIEKLNESDTIFTHDVGTLLQIECAKIITMPIHLKRTNAFAGHTAMEFSIKLKEKKDEKCISKNIELLREIIKKRIDSDEIASLIDNLAIDKIVVMSGGNIRQLTTIIREAALDAKDSSHISVKNVNSAIYDLKKQYSSATQIMKEFLDEIATNNLPKDFNDNSVKLLAKATKEQMIFAYHNSESWYDVNPIILDKEPCKID